MKNYKKTEHFEPIAMLANEKQIEQIRKVFKKLELKIFDTSINSNFPYLINWYADENKLGLGTYYNNLKLKVHETFDAKTFLNACGIVEVEKTHEITETLLLELAKDENVKEILKKEIPSLFDIELEVGKWYKDKYNSLICYNGLKKSYGFDRYGIFSRDNENAYFNFLSENNNQLATPQEVETALINEAKKRGLDYEVEFNQLSDEENGSAFLNSGKCGSDFHFKDNKLFVLGYGRWKIFDNGQWTSVIETPTDIITIVEKYGKDKVISLIEKM